MIEEAVIDGGLVLEEVTLIDLARWSMGGSVSFKDGSGKEVAYCVTDRSLHVFPDRDHRQRELLRITPGHGRYEVYDPELDEAAGFLRRGGNKRRVQAVWRVEGPDQTPLCLVEEASAGRHVLRFFLGEYFSTTYTATMDGQTLFTLERSGPRGACALRRMSIDPGPGCSFRLDPRLLLAAALCLFLFDYKGGLLWYWLVWWR